MDKIVNKHCPTYPWQVRLFRPRKPVYLVASALFMAGSAVLSLSKTIEAMIGMRVLQAAGSCAVMAISAATLADMCDTHERGTAMGIFFAAPLLGPALGPILGGSSPQAFNWRASFYLLLICEVIIFMSFLILFKDTYRRERSLTHCSALQRLPTSKERIQNANMSTITGDESSKDHTPVKDIEKQLQQPNIPDDISVASSTPGLDDVRLSIRDVNPFPPCFQILSRKNNVLILIPNGLVFGFSYCLSYTCARTLANSYDYSAFSIGLVLLCLGVGDLALLRDVYMSLGFGNFVNLGLLNREPLWFANFDDHDIQDKLQAALDRAPSRKFVFLSHQLSARMSKSSTELPKNQQNLRGLVLRMCQEHPFHSLHSAYVQSNPRAREDFLKI